MFILSLLNQMNGLYSLATKGSSEYYPLHSETVLKWPASGSTLVYNKMP